jgi:hypothetical protein
VRFRLVTLHGTATGRKSVRLGRALAETSHTVTRLRMTFHAITGSARKTLIRTDVVDTASALPTG